MSIQDKNKMILTALDYWSAECAYDFVNDYVTDGEWLKAFPMLTRGDFLDDPDQMDDDGYGDYEVIVAVVHHWEGYYTVVSRYDEIIVIELRVPECLDPNNISHYKR